MMKTRQTLIHVLTSYYTCPHGQGQKTQGGHGYTVSSQYHIFPVSFHKPYMLNESPGCTQDIKQPRQKASRV